MKSKHFNIPVFIPKAACPFQCIYCNQKKISGKQKIPNDSQIIHIIEEHLSTIPNKNTEIELAYFGGNFTGFPLNEQKHYLDRTTLYPEKKDFGNPALTRPDYISAEILELLKNNNVKTIELGAQSIDDEVLKKSKRGYTASNIVEASKLIKDYGFVLGLQMMIGLPGDSLRKSKSTAEKIIDLGAAETRIYPTLVIKDTILEKKFNEGLYKALTLTEAVNWSAQILPLFEKAGVKVLKLGLHPSEGLLSGIDLVAGPFHPSFRELVLMEIWRKLLDPLLNIPGDSITVEVSPAEINYAIGYGASNKKVLMQKFKKMKFLPNPALTGREFTYR